MTVRKRKDRGLSHRLRPERPSPSPGMRNSGVPCLSQMQMGRSGSVPISVEISTCPLTRPLVREPMATGARNGNRTHPKPPVPDSSAIVQQQPRRTFMEAQLGNALAASATDNDKVTAYGWKALAGSVIGYAMDGFDLLILGFMLPAISAGLGLTSTQAGSLVTWTLIGAVAGGLIFGTMSDHYGRIRVMTWT